MYIVIYDDGEYGYPLVQGMFTDFYKARDEFEKLEAYEFGKNALVEIGETFTRYKLGDRHVAYAFFKGKCINYGEE